MKTQLIAHRTCRTKRFPVVMARGGLVILRKYAGIYNVTHAASGFGLPGYTGGLRRCRMLLAHALNAASQFGFSWLWSRHEIETLYRLNTSLARMLARVRLDGDVRRGMSRAARRRWREGRVWL